MLWCCSGSAAVPMGMNSLSYSKSLAFYRNPKVRIASRSRTRASPVRAYRIPICLQEGGSFIEHTVFKGRSSFSPERNFSRLCQPICAARPELDTSVPDMKDIGATLRKSNVVIESRDRDTIQVRVDLSGKDTQKVFDDVLTNLARTAPAIPGFRKTKGGKMSNVPRDFLVRAIGEARVVKFVIQEIVSTTMTEYVEQETLKVKKEFKTIQTPEELESQFEPGKPFVFNATLNIDKSEAEMVTPSSEKEEPVSSSSAV